MNNAYHRKYTFFFQYLFHLLKYAMKNHIRNNNEYSIFKRNVGITSTIIILDVLLILRPICFDFPQNRLKLHVKFPEAAVKLLFYKPWHVVVKYFSG